MNNKELKEWWVKRGCQNLNKELLELSGSNIGFVPIENLLGDNFDISLVDQNELINILIKDGCFVRTKLLSSGETSVLIYIK